jgi:hypothetical protein
MYCPPAWGICAFGFGGRAPLAALAEPRRFRTRDFVLLAEGARRRFSARGGAMLSLLRMPGPRHGETAARLYASSSSGSKCGWNQICAIRVGTTALPITAVSRTVYCT